MSNVGLNSQYIVKHRDLVKFGLSSSTTDSSSSMTNVSQKIVEALLFLAELPNVTSQRIAAKTIEIYRRWNKNFRFSFAHILVDRDTGKILQTSNAFLNILRFDPKTFPKDDATSIDDVGYWDCFSYYQKPLNSH